MQTQYVIELRNNSKMWITADQATIVNRAWQDRSPVKVNGSLINTVDITGIWDEQTWYDNHPEDKLEVKSPVPQLSAPTQTEDTEKWRRVLRANKTLMLKGLLPRYTLKDHKVVDQPDYWRDTELTEKTVKGTIVKKSVTDHEYRRKYANRNGYHLAGKDYDKNIIIFTVVGEIPPGCDPATPQEISAVYGL